MGSSEPPPSNSWVVGPCILQGGELAFLKFTREYSGRPRDGYATQTIVQLKLLAPSVNGQVGHEENERLKEIERSLVAAVGDEACYVGFATHSGLRSYYFYVRSKQWLRTWRNENNEAVSRHELTVWVKDDPGWATYQRLLDKATEAMSDLQVLMKIDEVDADMTSPRRVDWTLVFPDDRQAVSARAEIESADPEITVLLVSRGDQIICQASKVAVLDLGFMLDFNALIRSIASRTGGQFDGWGAEINARAQTS